jgi:hypothetical protein
LSDEIKEEWHIWRLIIEGVATYTELSTIIDYSECIKMNAILNMKNDMEKFLNKPKGKK